MNKRQFLIQNINDQIVSLSDLSERWRDDYDIALAAIQIYGNRFEDVSCRLRNDKSIVLAALNTRDPTHILDSISDYLKDDKDVMIKAVRKSMHSFFRASSGLRGDKEFILSTIDCAIRLSDNFLSFLSTELRDNKDVVLNALSRSSSDIIQFASERLQNDYEIAMNVISKHGTGIQFLSPSILLNDNVKIQLIQKFSVQPQGWPCSPEYIRSDKPLAIRAVKHDSRNFEFVSDELKGDKDVVLSALSNHSHQYKKSSSILQFATPDLRNDEQVIKRAIIHETYEVLDLASDELKDNEGLIRFAIIGDTKNTTYRGNPMALKFASARLRNNESVVSLALQNSSVRSEVFAFASYQIRNNRKLVYEFINKGVLRHASPQIRKDKDLVLAAMKFDVTVLEVTPKELQLDCELKDLWMHGIGGIEFRRRCQGTDRASIPFFLRDDERAMMAALSSNCDFLSLTSTRLRDNKDVVIVALKSRKESIAFISDRLLDDKEVAMVATSGHPENLKYLSERLRGDNDVLVNCVKWTNHKVWNGKKDEYESSGIASHSTIELFRLQRDNRDFVHRAVRKDGRLLEYASDKLKLDREVVLAALISCPSISSVVPNILMEDPVVKIASKDYRRCRDIPDELLSEREYALAVVSDTPELLKRLPPHFKGDMEIVSAAIGGNSRRRIENVLQYASPRLRDYEDLLRVELVACSYKAGLAYASNRLRGKKDLVEFAINANPDNFQFASSVLRDDIEIAEMAFKIKPTLLKWASKRLKNRIELAMRLVSIDWRVIEFVSDSLKGNRELVSIAVSQSIYGLDYASPDLRSDIVLVNDVASRFELALERNQGREPLSISKALLECRDVVKKGVSQSHFGQRVRHLPEHIRDDMEIMEVAVKADGEAFEYASARLRNSMLLLLLALKNTSSAINYASENLKKDSQVKNALWQIRMEEREISYMQDRSENYYASMYENLDCCPACHESPCYCSDPF